MKFYSENFLEYNEQNSWNLNCFRLVFCLLLIIPVLKLQIPAGIYKPIPTLEWTHVFIRTAEAFFLLKITTAVLLLLAGIGIWSRFCLWTTVVLLFFLVANTYSFVYDPITGYMPNDFNLPWMVLLILSLSPGISQMNLKGVLKSSTIKLNPISKWPITLILWTLGSVYLAAFVSKMHWGGWRFGDGNVLQSYLLEFGLFRGNNMTIWLSSQPALTLILATVILLFELTAIFGFSLVRLRFIYVLMGIAFHTAIFILFGIDFLTKYLPVYFICVNWSGFRVYFKSART